MFQFLFVGGGPWILLNTVGLLRSKRWRAPALDTPCPFKKKVLRRRTSTTIYRESLSPQSPRVHNVLFIHSVCENSHEHLLSISFGPAEQPSTGVCVHWKAPLIHARYCHILLLPQQLRWEPAKNMEIEKRHCLQTYFFPRPSAFHVSRSEWNVFTWSCWSPSRKVPRGGKRNGCFGAGIELQ